MFAIPCCERTLYSFLTDQRAKLKKSGPDLGHILKLDAYENHMLAHWMDVFFSHFLSIWSPAEPIHSLNVGSHVGPTKCHLTISLYHQFTQCLCLFRFLFTIYYCYYYCKTAHTCLCYFVCSVFGHQNNLKYLTRSPKVVVISYTMLHRLRKSMLEQEWALMIVDECHNIRCTKKMMESEEVCS